MTGAHSKIQSEPGSSVAVRMVVGVLGFAWVSLLLLWRLRYTSPDPYWPAYLIVGAVFGAAATVVTRGAGRRPLGRLLGGLGWVWLCAIAAVLLLHPGSDIYVEFLPVEKFIATTTLPVVAWLFLSSRAGRRGP